MALLMTGVALHAQAGLAVDVKPVVEGKASAGGEYTLKLQFTVPAGYHAYHKDNPGYGLAPIVNWTELAGLELVKQTWPEPHKRFYPELDVTEWEYDGTFEIGYTFKVPAGASGTLSLAGNHTTQFCDAEGCYITEGPLAVIIDVEGAAPTVPAAPEPAAPTATVSAAFDGTATAGGTATLKLDFALPTGFHAYHKDNATVGGYGVPPQVTFDELAGLTLESEAWPEAKKVRYEDDWHELEYAGSFTLTYVFKVPADAEGTKTLAGGYKLQICDEHGCYEDAGKFSAALKIEAASPAEDRARKDVHGFYLDFDYAFELAKQTGKPLLVDFNGKNCPPCRIMEKRVFTLPEVKKLFEDYVIVSVKNDIRDPRYDELWQKYRPSPAAPVPYYAVLNENAEVVRAIGSTLPAEKRGHEFVSFLKGEKVERAAKEAAPAAVEPALQPSADGWPQGLKFQGPLPHIEQGFEFEAKFSAPKVKPGAEVTLELHFRMKQNDEGEEYYLYHKDTEFGVPLVIKTLGHEGVEPVGDWSYPTPKKVVEEGIGTMLKLTGNVVLMQTFKVPENAVPGSLRVFGTASGQYCDSGGCIQFERDDPSKPDRKFGWVATLQVAADGVENAVVEQPADEGNGESSSGIPSELWLFLLFAFGAGMVTLLTPCVLPVIPLTIGFFVSQAEKGRSSLLTAFIYCTCIVVSFTLFGLITSLALGATGAQNIATNGWVNSFLGALFLVFALSFLGMFELRVPTFMTAWFNKKQMSAQKEGNGYAKAFFSGSAFALISFSCTGPIAGAFLAESARAGSDGVFAIWRPTLAMLAFSSGMALPIFIMGQFPAVMKKLPRSGGWMNALKVVFGFIEIGLAVLYFSAAEQAFGSVKAAEWLNRYVVIAVWMSVSVASSLYLFGVFRMPHDHEKTEQIGVVRSIFAVMFLAFALYLLPGMFGARLGATLEGILPLPPKDAGIQLSWGTAGKGNDAEDLPWIKNLEEGLEVSAKVNKPVFVDFTGFN